MQKLNVRASLIEIYSRVVKLVENDDNIYYNGDNNLYPYEIEGVINNSPTAKRAKDIMGKFIAGRGVENDLVVNKKNNLKLSDIVNHISEDLAEQNGSFIWVGYGFNEKGEIIPNKIKVLDYSNCRISKSDDNEYPGKIYVKDFSYKRKFFVIRKKQEKKWYYPFNSNKEVVKEQMIRDSKKDLEGVEDEIQRANIMVSSYRGQVFHLNRNPRYQYALSKFDAVYNDMDSEYRFSLYVNTQMREGFLGKTVALTQGLDEEQEKNTRKDLAKFLGAENSGSIYHMNVDQADKLKEVLKIIQLQPQLNDKLFVENDKRIRRNILGAANNLPEPFIYAGEGALFGTSGDTYREMKLFYQEQTEKDRTSVENALKTIGYDVEIIPIVEETEIQPQND